MNLKGQFLGHATFSWQLPSGKIILLDPYLSDNPATPEAYKSPKQVDYIVLTHGHHDHVGDTIEIAERTGCKVYAILELIALLQEAGLSEKQCVGYNIGGTVQIEDTTVTLVKAEHSSAWKNKYAGSAGGVVIRFSDTFCFYHMGDTSYFSELKWYGEFYKPDLVAVPIGDHFTMGPQEAAYSCMKMNIKNIIPMHYGTFPVLVQNTSSFETALKMFSHRFQVIKPKIGDDFMPMIK